MARRVYETISIDAKEINVSRVMEKTEPRPMANDLYISVPDNYSATVYLDGEPVKKLKPCARKKLKKFVGSDKVGKQVSVLYINKRQLTTMSWGIGNLPIKYDFLDGMCIKVGANGTFLATMTDPEAFFEFCGARNGSLSLTETVSRITAAFREHASLILTGLFKEAIEPVFDTEFMLAEMDRRINSVICEKELKNIPGIIFKTSTVTGICVCEEDIRAYRERFINSRHAVRK